MPVYDEWVLHDGEVPASEIPIAHPALRAIFARRGVTTADDFRRFTAPVLADLHDPAGIDGMAFACERIERAIRDREAIVIYGDYDVDGVTSIVLLQSVVRSLGGDVTFVVPQRLVDGYGLKIEVLERVLSERAVRLVITVDCGITSVEPVQRALERGIDVIVTDHHLPPGVLPAAAALLNPKREGCAYPFKDLAGVGVAFKLCCELVRRSGRKISTESLLKLAAIGTIADVAPLTGENRAIAILGLRGLDDVRNLGLKALLQRAGIYGRRVRATDIGFKVGPRINAAGRLASADTAIELFAAATAEDAWRMCGELDAMNAQRQSVELSVREAAEAQFDPRCRIAVLAGKGWHRGVVGLTAGRLAQKFHRPVLCISIEGDQCVGSARSIPTIDLHAQLERVAGLFTHFGGHEFACGFSLPAANLPALRERLEAAFDQLDEALFARHARVEAVIALRELDREFGAAHEMLEPFGAGNPQPLFLAEGVTVIDRRPFATDCCELTLEQGDARARAVVWPGVKELAAALECGPGDVLFTVEPDRYAPAGLRMVLADARPAARGAGAVTAIPRQERTFGPGC